MQIPILSGIYTEEMDYRKSYPLNLVPVSGANGIADGYLKPADGIVQIATGPGVDRGAVEWGGYCFRVMGSSLILLGADNTITVLGTIAGTDPVRFTYSFDRLAIAGGGKLYYWGWAVPFSEVTDVDLGTVNDVTWVDGYFMTTDGENLVITELIDPTAVDPLKYGSSEVDPDPVKALLKIRNEIYAINRHTIESFQNIGGEEFPFERIEGAQITKGAVSKNACCVFLDAIAFLGGGRNEVPGIWLGSNGNAVKLSDRELDLVLAGYQDSDLVDTFLEARVDRGNSRLFVHLPDITYIYDPLISEEIGIPVWTRRSSSINGIGPYRGRNAVWCYSKWIVGDTDSAAIGELSDENGQHWGEDVKWEFGTQIVYNEGRGAIMHQIELVGLTGRTAVGDDPYISAQWSSDGVTWSQERSIRVGQAGDRDKRLCWRKQGRMKQRRIYRFFGHSDSRLTVTRLEASIEGLT